MSGSEAQFQISTLERGVIRVAMMGELDIAQAKQFQQVLDDLIGKGQTRLLIDLSPVSFIDSSGLGVLLHAVRRLRRRRGRLAVVCPDPMMRELFELVGHNLLFPIEDTQEKALTHLVGRRRFAPSRRSPGSPSGSPPPTSAA